MSDAYDVVDAYFTWLKANSIEPECHVTWYLDSRASNHITGNETVSSFSPTVGHKIRSAGGQGHAIIGIGNVSVKMNTIEIKVVQDVMFSPCLIKNVISVGYVADKILSLRE